jgi:GT2 family glycosyltransferase
MQHQTRQPVVSINIVTWNSMKFLPDLLETIFKQTYQDFVVRVIDNASSDGLEEFLRKTYPQVAFLRNQRNLGFSNAHNQGIRLVVDHCPKKELDTKYILVCNPDILMSDTFLEELMRVAQSAPETVGSFGGKLLRAFGENLADEVLMETVRSDLIDSTGLNPHKNRTVTDRGAGERDDGQYDDDVEAFGVSGACVLYRVSALESVRYKDEYYDHEFFAYKEDVDMAWRLQHAGWESRFAPKAIAHHYRGMYGKEDVGMFSKVRNRRRKSSRRNYYSTRNHWLMLIKNLRVSSAIFALPRITLYESARMLYIFLLEPSSLMCVIDTIKLIPSMIRKRRVSVGGAKVRARDVRKWFV